MTAPSPEARRPGALTAAGLSFLWPGLGQLARGRRRTAAALAIPALVVLLALGVRLVGRLDQAAITLLDPGFAIWVLIAVVALAGWRILAIADAWRDGLPLPASGRARAVLGALVAAVLLSHAVVGYYAWAFYDAGSRIFTSVQPTPSPSPSASPSVADSAAPSASPDPTAPPSDRISILLIGKDSGHDRDHALTDTMLVVSMSPSQGTLTMVSFPRDISQFPLYLGGTFNDDKLNALMTYARLQPNRFPDGPTQTLANELGYLLGIRVQYTAQVNLDGFEKMINVVGGIDIVNPKQIADSTYDWFNGTYGFYLSPGPHHLDGRNALAYVRSRKGVGDNDFTRADRQQQVVLALRKKLLTPASIAKLPQLLDIAKRAVTTNLSPDQLKQYLALSDEISSAKVQRYVLGPPYSVHPPTESTGGTYILRLDLDLVASLSVQLFGTDSRYYGLPGASPATQPSPTAAP